MSGNFSSLNPADFEDLARDLIVLYETPDHPFARPAKLSPEEAYREAQVNFDKWFPSATGFLDTARYVLSQVRLNEAAFQLHQAAERFFHCLLLTETLYSTKSHNLNFLRGQAERVAPELIPAWPRSNRAAGSSCGGLTSRRGSPTSTRSRSSSWRGSWNA